MWSVSIFLKNVFGLYKRLTNYFEISIKTRKKEEETDVALTQTQHLHTRVF